jgi:hypothetical protein
VASDSRWLCSDVMGVVVNMVAVKEEKGVCVICNDAPTVMRVHDNGTVNLSVSCMCIAKISGGFRSQKHYETFEARCWGIRCRR